MHTQNLPESIWVVIDALIQCLRERPDSFGHTQSVLLRVSKFWPWVWQLASVMSYIWVSLYYSIDLYCKSPLQIYVLDSLYSLLKTFYDDLLKKKIWKGFPLWGFSQSSNNLLSLMVVLLSSLPLHILFYLHLELMIGYIANNWLHC